MTILVPMTGPEFADYLAFAIPDFAKDKVESGQWAPADALEAEVQKRGLSGIALHVFGQNTGAQALYRTLGFVTTNINMFKQLADAKA